MGKTIFGDVPQNAAERVGDTSTKPLFLFTDFCPFAARSHICLLEKEKDPSSITLVKLQHVAYFLGTRDPGTAVLYDLNLKTAPALVHHNQVFSESSQIAYYIDEIFPEPPLKPQDPIMKYNYQMFLDRHSSMSSLYYELLLCTDKEKQKGISKRLHALIQAIDEDLQLFDGPFLCGEQFTLADIQIFPFFERCFVVLAHYRNVSIPSSLKALDEWYRACADRPSVRSHIADRSPLSMATYDFESSKRDDYLIEVYLCYSRNEIALLKQIEKESGAPGRNAYRKHVRGLEENKE
jgi:glutathione S-transferase